MVKMASTIPGIAHISLPESLAEPVPSLQSLCTKTIANMLKSGHRVTGLSETANYQVLQHLSSNEEMTDNVLECFSRREQYSESDDEGMDVDGVSSSPWGSDGIPELRWLDLSGKPAVSLKGLKSIMTSHRLEHLDLSGLDNVSDIIPACVTSLGPYLKSLSVSGCRIMPASATGDSWYDTSDDDEDPIEPVYFKFPALETLDLSRTDIRGQDLCWLPKKLRVLSLEGTLVNTTDVNETLCNPDLVALNLSNTKIQYHCRKWTFFKTHPKLQRLDLSSCTHMMDQSVDVADPSRADFFEQMALHGKDLRWVNVCMLKLDGECITKLLSLPRLQFLGLYGTNVLEEEIAECDKSIGVAAAFTKDQLLLGLHEVGRNNHDCAKGMLRTLFSMLCPDGGHEGIGAPQRERITSDHGGVITELVVDILEKHEAAERSDNIALLATATLFYLTAEHTMGQTLRARLRALRALLLLLQRLILRRGVQGANIAKNCCLAMRNFRLEGELSRCARFVAIALLRAALKYHDRTLQHTAVLLCCHNLASLHPRHKEGIGAAEPEGGIDLVLRLIADQHAALTEQEDLEDTDYLTLELCWTFLWNITDETPRNVQRFIARRGMATMLYSLETFPTVVALRRNVMGLVTNIAEVPAFRAELLQVRVLEQLHTCLVDGPNDLEVTYNVAGTLCHVLSDGEAFWLACGRTLELRRTLLDALATVVLGWNMATERWINYRSLTPIVRLLHPDLEGEVHMWATWAVASLCTVTRDKYCEMCVAEGVVDALERLQKHTPGPSAWVHARIATTLSLCREWHIEHCAREAVLAGHMDCRGDDEAPGNTTVL